MRVVALNRLSKRYGARLAVDQVSFEVAKGEILGLLGPNGSGKTTILRMLTGYLRPSAGTAEVAGLDVVRNGRAARERVGYVPEDAPLYPYMRVDEFLTFMGRMRGLEGPCLERALALARERLALDGVRATIIARLSRGYRQRVALAQALLHEPDLLVLDEPTNGLDPRQIIEFRGLVRAAAEHCAVILTSHILGEIERVADRAAILLDGRLLAVQAVGSSAVLRIRTHRDGAAQLRSILATTAGVEQIVEERVGDEAAAWRVRLAHPGTQEHLVSALCASGMTIVEVGKIGADLEATFLALTAERKRVA